MSSSASKPTTRRWISADPTTYWEIPVIAAVYAIVLDGRVVYVGQTNNLFRRFNAYRMRLSWSVGVLTPWGQVEGELVLKYSPSRRYGDWAMRELRLIRRLRPVWNCVGSTAERRYTGKYQGRKGSRTTNRAVTESLQ